MARRAHNEDDDFENDEERGTTPKKKCRRRSRQTTETPEPVDGVIIPTSKTKLLGLLALGLVFTPVCLFLLYDGLFIGEENTVLPFRMTWWGYFLVVAGSGVGLICLFAGPYGFLYPTQIVLGKRYLQEQQKSGADWNVILQIPFDNIRRVRFENTHDDTFIGIKFFDHEDKQTYCKDGTAFDTAREKGWDYILNGLYTMGLKEIAKEIDRCRPDDDEE